MSTRSLSAYFDVEFSDLMDKNLQDHGIELIYGATLEAILGNKKVEAVQTDKGKFATDMVIMCIGFQANTVLGHTELELFKNGAYLVNKKQETSIKDVYAIGDCATVYDNALLGTNYIALATNAVRSGLVAAHQIGGIDLESAGVQGSNGINIYDLKMISTGMTVSVAEKHGLDVAYTEFHDNQRPEFMRENEMVHLRIVYEKTSRRIVGMQAASNYDIHLLNHMFSLAIQEKVTIDKLALTDIFFLPHFNKPYNYITMAALSAK